MSSLEIIVDKILKFLEKQPKPEGRPFILGISGPQGSGKSTLASALDTELTRKNESVVKFSLDDFYLTHAEQVELAKNNPNNPLVQHRGLAGTHDVTFLNNVLNAFVKGSDEEVSIPFYDQSKFGGYGDRGDESQWKKANPKTTTYVIFEGWMVGFEPLDSCMLSVRARSTRWQNIEGSLLWVNRKLADYQPIFQKIDSLVELEAQEINYVYRWRLQQEHALKARIHKGMSDEEVIEFVNHYMPQYVFYLGTLSNKVHLNPHCLEIILDENRYPVVMH
nr:unnamed protein product [Schizosaccharomyces pombe]